MTYNRHIPNRPSFLNRISLSRLNVHLSNSEETHCFTATLSSCREGKPICIVSNSGRGGSHEYRPFTRGGRLPLKEDYKAMREGTAELDMLAKQESIKSKHFEGELTLCLETAISILVSESLALKEHMRRCKRMIVVHSRSRGFCKITRGRKTVTPTKEALASANENAEQSGDVVINRLSEGELLEYLYKIGDL